MSVTTPEVDDVEVDLDGNLARATIRQELAIDDLFNPDGELRLWEDDAGWDGYLAEQDEDGEIAYFFVNTRHDEDDWARKVRVGKRAVTIAIKEHIEDPAAGGAGTFARRCSPP